MNVRAVRAFVTKHETFKNKLTDRLVKLRPISRMNVSAASNNRERGERGQHTHQQELFLGA